MKFLLPHPFKKAGAWMAPCGFLFWVLMQRRVISSLLVLLLGPEGPPDNPFPYNNVNIVVAIISFPSFLAGLYFISFSREKIEDELVQRIRLESFQFAALVQLASSIGILLFFAFVREPESDFGLEIFFLGELFLFWICYICRFQIALWRR